MDLAQETRVTMLLQLTLLIPSFMTIKAEKQHLQKKLKMYIRMV